MFPKTGTCPDGGSSSHIQDKAFFVAVVASVAVPLLSWSCMQVPCVRPCCRGRTGSLHMLPNWSLKVAPGRGGIYPPACPHLPNYYCSRQGMQVVTTGPWQS